MHRTCFFFVCLLLVSSCSFVRKQPVQGRYSSAPTSDFVIGVRRLFSQGTVTGLALQLTTDKTYVLRSCGGTSRGTYVVSGAQVCLYQHDCVAQRHPTDTMLVPDTTVYHIRKDGSLKAQFKSYYYSKGQRKSITSIAHLTKVD
jgi:hypothetical protein